MQVRGGSLTTASSGRRCAPPLMPTLALLEGIMRINELRFRQVLIVCGVLLFIVGLVVALGVIPPVKVDTYPGVKHGKVVAAFWINIGLNLLAAFVLFFMSLRITRRNWLSTTALSITGLLVLFLGLALADAASAYQGHGPSMQTASILLFICAAVDFLSGVTVIITAFLRPKTF
jgi:hypothetical protein